MNHAQSNITPELIRDGLAYIPANQSRDVWARIGMAIKSEYPDATGFDLFDQWSASDPDRYNAKDVNATWRSIKASGGVGIATLLHLAKEHGFTLPKSGQASEPPSPDEIARRERERTERQRAEQARIDTGHAQAAEQAAKQFADASTDGESPYLMRKGVQAHGVKFAAGGRLLVPLRDGAGKLWNLQSIAPTKPQDGAPEKLFLKNGRKSGLWHMVGSVASDQAPPVVLIAEGLATASTLFEATGHPVATAFDAGNLGHVARALRKLWPAALLVLCGDDDKATEASTGHNPGREKATAAARAVRGLAIFPEGLPPGGSDFNDLHAHHGGAAGLEAVRGIVQTAIDAHGQGPTEPPNGAPDAPQGQPKGEASKAPRGGAGGPQDGGDKAAPDWDRFDVTEGGVFYRGVDRDGKPTAPEWVCSRLEVEAATRDQDGNGWGYLLTFSDLLNHPKQWAMPSRMLAGEGGEYRAALLGMGLRIATSPRARNLLTQYIQSRQPDTFATCTDRIGWHGRAFVLPHETIGDGAERIVFQSESAQPNTFSEKGTPEQWAQRIAAPCAGNSRLVFGLACAFAGPLLRPAGLEGGGFHLRGDGSTGKSTAQIVAGSVYGKPERFKQSWKATDNALEGIAAQHNDCLLILDEIGEVDPKAIGDIVYMLGNGQGKARASRTGAPRTRLAWRLLFLSSGEKSLSDHMQEAGKRTRAGQETRMADIPADAGMGLGAFEDVHGHEGGAAFSRYLVAQAGSVYGATGRAWLEWLTDNADTLKARVREGVEAWAREYVAPNASGQVQRVGGRFALVAAAGELATAAGLTGWAAGESDWAARECFNAWVAARGGTGNGEVVAMLRQVRRFLEAHGDGRFTWWHRADDDHNAKTLHRAGMRRMVNDKGEPIKKKQAYGTDYTDRMAPAMGAGSLVEYLVFPEVFKAELCQGFDSQAVARVLLEHGCLVRKEADRFTVKERIDGIGPTWCYRIPARIFELDL